MKTYCGMEVEFHAFLTLAVDVGEWLASQSAVFTTGEKVPDTHWVGRWMVSRARLDTGWYKEKSLSACPAGI
jgi:hypothetical protein